VRSAARERHLPSSGDARKLTTVERCDDFISNVETLAFGDKGAEMTAAKAGRYGIEPVKRLLVSRSNLVMTDSRGGIRRIPAMAAKLFEIVRWEVTARVALMARWLRLSSGRGQTRPRPYPQQGPGGLVDALRARLPAHRATRSVDGVDLVGRS
jgi:hypothetical protein